ncbi:MAG: MBL fold metallo-hydrolase [Synergistaceae bacterium]|jgi:competence protein ComEC|nr:MBL fold metallo-hydrolase [Synergistaceae bacterium]
MKKQRSKKLPFAIKAAAFLLFVILSVFNLPKSTPPGLSLYAFDTGQGDAFLFRLPDGKNILVDAGTGDFAAELVARLKNLGVRKIDVAVASHPHEDHIGGMPAVLEAIPVERFWDSGYNHGSPLQRKVLEILRGKKIKFERPQAGYREMLGEVLAEVAAPVKKISKTTSDANNNSIVLRISYGNISFLMTGDMETAERKSVKKFPRSTVLKISHHGSANGTDARLMREVSPDAVIFTYGKGNSYGHPHRPVVELVRKSGARSYATADGEILMNTDGQTLTVERP